MTDEYSASSTRGAAPTLQRGKACLRCRKRKMRCDGAKPSCQQCARAKKQDLCEYDDGRGKTRTQLLRETIARLEARIQELESPEHTSTSVPLFDPHAIPVSEDSSSCSADSPSSFPSFSTSQSPNPVASISSPPHVDCCSPVSWMSSDRCFPDSPNRMFTAHVAPELAQSLLETFIPHRDQLFLGLHVERLRNSLHRPVEEQRHPMLMNAIFLWACYFSRVPNLSRHEPLYLSRTTEAFHDWLRAPAKVVDVIRACCLLSQYFLVNGRVMEGGHYGSTAAALALQWGLHRQGSEHRDVGMSLEGSFSLPQPRDAIERGERILAFWQVFCLDRCWSAALHRPSLISDGPGGLSSIIVPWPQDIVEYEVENFHELAHLNTVQSFLTHQIQVPVLAGGFSNFACVPRRPHFLISLQKLPLHGILVRGSIYENKSFFPSFFFRSFFLFKTRFVFVSTASATLTQLSEQDMLAVEDSITRFIASLIPVHQMGALHVGDKHNLIVVHALAQAALIRLYYLRAEVDQLWSEKCMHAARGMLSIIGQVSDMDIELLDPIVGSCQVLWVADWGLVVLLGISCSRFIREIAQVESWSPVTSNELGSHVGTIANVLSRLSMTFPLAGAVPRRFLCQFWFTHLMAMTLSPSF
ncbi:hypothetical protein B0F90DRAFT_1911982 [Multifurca ochricompacta]|uniref:Zn(2)-C6 fungal-type domain-containing protein n=1 Tax=Multifurca ochricompacta TaxID=376703 RepID=A0AAD4M3Q3_9AGAM|nr:hypothetical protein B0F90DRAFT_1911982 [Multifurca ochricompacta]